MLRKPTRPIGCREADFVTYFISTCYEILSHYGTAPGFHSGQDGGVGQVFAGFYAGHPALQYVLGLFRCSAAVDGDPGMVEGRDRRLGVGLRKRPA